MINHSHILRYSLKASTSAVPRVRFQVDDNNSSISILSMSTTTDGATKTDESENVNGTTTQNEGMAEKTSETMTEAFSTLNSMWSSWMSGNRSTLTENKQVKEKESQGDGDGQAGGSSGGGIGNEWLTGAGKMWESAVKDVGYKWKEATENVDTAMLGESVEVVRKKSVRLMEDVSKSVQNIQLGLDGEELQKKANELGNSTRQLLDRGMKTLEMGRSEALEVFVDEEKKTGDIDGKPPWDEESLPEGEKKYADALRREMLKLVVDGIYSKKKRTELFLSNVAEKERFEFVMEDNMGMATAALEADGNMRRLRAGLVPGKVKEEEFWKSYFFHVMRVRQTLVANNGVMPETDGDGLEEEDPEILFGEGEVTKRDDQDGDIGNDKIDTNEGDGGGHDGDDDGKKRNWDDEIDAIFDEQE